MDTMSLEQNPLLSEVVLARPEELITARCPTVALHLLVKNGESCVGRLIDNVGPYIHAVVAVVNDTTDKTIEVLRAKCAQYDLSLDVVEVTAQSHPGFYIMDEWATYQYGSALTNESFEGPFTGKPLLANWAAVRNLGWEISRAEWKLFLDADDEVEDPESIPGLCLALEERGIELATTRYQFQTTTAGHSQSDAFRERLAANVPSIKWHGRVHEVLKGQATTAHIEGNLRVVDRRDSQGEGLRPVGRNFKVLYREARLKGWQVSPRTLIYLAMESKETMPGLAKAALNLYLEKSTWCEERAWACIMCGEICEAEGDIPGASEWYQKSLRVHPGSKAAFRLAKTLFQEGKWRDTVDAYYLGMSNKSFLQVIDNGQVFEDATKILVAVALRKMGRYTEGLVFCKDALAAHPMNTTLQSLYEELTKAAARQPSPAK
jgi:tetratricopeptide (TPR) repeat protein